MNNEARGGDRGIIKERSISPDEDVEANHAMFGDWGELSQPLGT